MILKDFCVKLSIDSLNTGYLRDLSLNIDAENVVILGSNGAGKTTLAKSIVSLIETDSVLIDGINVSTLNARERSKLLNLVPSKLEVFDEYISVYEFLKLSLLNGTPESEIEKILELLKITHLKEQSCKEISTGESQLVLFASGLLHNAVYTLYDEPTANLDSSKKITVFNLLRQSIGLKMVITHDLNLAFKLGYRVVYLHDGSIIYDGPCSTFFKPENIEKVFGNTIRRIDDFFMVNYR